MPIQALHQIRRMRGHTQCHLMLGSDHNPYVVKFRNNPLTYLTLASDMFGSRLAASLGFTTTPCVVVEVSQWLISNSPDLVIKSGAHHEACAAGDNFGSLYVGGMSTCSLFDYIPEERHSSVHNLREFTGMLAFDQWTSNTDLRQAVYAKSSGESKYLATFIDQGHCFSGGSWIYRDSPANGLCIQPSLYKDVTGWESFEPWLTQMETITGPAILQIAMTVPREWFGPQEYILEHLVNGLLDRRRHIRNLILAFRDLPSRPFPNWIARTTSPASRANAIPSDAFCGCPLRPSSP